MALVFHWLSVEQESSLTDLVTQSRNLGLVVPFTKTRGKEILECGIERKTTY